MRQRPSPRPRPRPGRHSLFRTGLIGGLLAVAITLGAGSAPAAAQESDAPPAPLDLVAQTAVVPADGQLVLRFDLGDLALDGGRELALAVTVFGRIEDVDGLNAEPLAPLNRLPVVPLSRYPIDADGVVTVRMPIRHAQPFDDLERILIPDPGVYPVRVEVRDAGRVRGELQTTLIRLPADPDGDEGADGPGEAAGGGRSVAVVLVLESDAGSELTAAAELLAAYPDLPVTIVLDPGRLAELQRDQALAAAFREAIGGRPVLPIAEPFLDPSSLAAIEQGALYQATVESARAATAALGLVPAPDAVVVAADQTRRGARLLSESGMTTAFDVRAPSTTPTPRSPGAIATATGPVAVLPGDELGRELLAEASPAARTQRLLASLLLTERSGPFVLAVGGEVADPFVTLALLLPAFQEAAVDVLPLADAATAAASSALDATGAPVEDLSALAPGLLEAQDLLATYETFYIDGPHSPTTYRDELTRALAIDTYREDGGNESGDASGSRGATITDIGDRLRSELSVISLPETQSVTLAARSVPIPLTIESRATGTRQVLLEFRSDKIVVAEHGQLITVEPGTSSIDVEVASRSLGVSPLEVSVLSPDGRHLLSTTRFQVRSTAVPGLGLLISAVGLGVLGAWWYLSIRRKRSAHPSRSGLPPPSAEQAAEGEVDRDAALAGDSV